ncbi:ATP-binding protein [Neobacillus sp. OS1-32]|uniref:ATP-binding protein n=1 Tax=Neobacillus TaxID=2675232 RepID=UPI0027DEE291|nr:ATP-binding protein [Neobacillus sp. OS1-32]WML32003.1 ATP-binding protein [Neobacillus sp. OS1-32]
MKRCDAHEHTILQGVDTKRNKKWYLKGDQQRYKRVFEYSMDGLILWDHQGRIVDINLAGEKLFCLSKNQLIGKFVYEPFIKQEHLIQEIIYHIEKTLKDHFYTSTFVIEGKDGNNRYIECNSTINITDGLNFTVFKEITDKIEMQEQLLKSETLNVIGELAAGIAHEIKNPMTALKGFIQLLEGSIKANHEMYYQVITTELERIESIINEFLLLAKPQSIKFQEKDINQIMQETVGLLYAHAVLHNVQIDITYEEGPILAFCEPNQLKKVFINLIKNAIEVMPNGGTISITVKRIENNQIYISIKDEGSGIAKEKLSKLGQPFYTTKEKGTGLGLMVSYKIIEEHNGTIVIESEEGKGSIFHIKFPLDPTNEKSGR